MWFWGLCEGAGRGNGKPPRGLLEGSRVRSRDALIAGSLGQRKADRRQKRLSPPDPHFGSGSWRRGAGR